MRYFQPGLLKTLNVLALDFGLRFTVRIALHASQVLSYPVIFHVAAQTPCNLLHADRVLRFSDDLFKARVAAQRIPQRQQFQLTIAEAAWEADRSSELFAREIFTANPRGDHRQILDQGDTTECIFFHGKKLDRQKYYFEVWQSCQ